MASSSALQNVISLPYRWKSRFLIRQAREAQRKRDWSAAATLWGDVVRVAPRHVGAWVQLGNMFNELERRDEAISAFKRAAELDPALPHAPAGVAGVHERAGRWKLAEASWNEAIALLLRNKNDDRSREELAHGFAHAALSARSAGAPGRATQHLESAFQVIPDLQTRANYLLMRAELLPPGQSEATAAFLQDFLRLLPDSVEKEIGASAEITRGNLFLGLIAISPYLALGREDADFLAIAAGLYERSRLWPEVIRIAEWQAELEPDAARHIERAFRAAVQGVRLADARRLARRYARATSELLLIHELAKLYEAVGALARARLLIRMLRRRWPHSRWHAMRYITLTAATRSLDMADQLVQVELATVGRDRELELAYCHAAFDAGCFGESRLRLEAFLERHDDADAEVLLGYALANAAGIDEGERHFMRIAARRMQSLGPTIGQAHMAMRRRDMPAALQRWKRVATIHSGVTVANVEMARCAYEMRDIDTAVQICKRHLERFPHDVGVGEFYAWLLTVNGRYEDARSAIEIVQTNSGPSWETSHLSIVCAAHLGTLDRDWSAILATMPASEAADQASRLYHAVRALVAFGRTDLVTSMLEHPSFAGLRFPWIMPYRATTKRLEAPVHPETSWNDTNTMIRSDIAARLDKMSDADVDLMLAGRAGKLPAVHIVNKFEQPRGGSELHALDLAAQLRVYTNVGLWAPEMPHPEFTALQGVRTIDPSAGNVPRGGVLVFIGIYFDIAKWVGLVEPERIIFLYNTFEAPSLFARIEEAYRRTRVQPELLYCSAMMQAETGLPGRFEPSPTDTEIFSPGSLERPEDRPFTLGRHSRDVPEKHGADDWKVYRAVSELGGESVVLGGTCMRKAYPPIRGLHLLKAQNEGMPSFLRGLDAYFYRTSTWIEPWGRVVIEAMACGVPVVAHSVGGYAQAIRHEQNGFLFDTTEEAVRLIRRLAEEPALRRRLGDEACRSVRDLLSTAEMRRLVAFYLFHDR